MHQAWHVACGVALLCRFLPDKAIDLLDEAGSRVRIQAYLARKRLQVRRGAAPPPPPPGCQHGSSVALQAAY